MPDAGAVARAIDLAVDARARAYAPYSSFLMGAGVVGDDGRTTSGVLVENVSLGLAMCAERVALFAAVTQGIRPVVLALCSERTDDALTFPCGACLQVALEIAGPELLVASVDLDGVSDSAPLASLVPRAPRRHMPGRPEGADPDGH